MSLAWTADGTELAGAGGNGTVVFAQLVQRSVEWLNYEARLVEPKLIMVTDAGAESYERLEFPRDRVVELALGWGHLVVATTTQCFIYSTTNWHTPHIFDLRASAQLIVLAESYFAMMDGVALTVYSYEGRVVSNPRFNGLRPELLSRVRGAPAQGQLCDFGANGVEFLVTFSCCSRRWLSPTTVWPFWTALTARPSGASTPPLESSSAAPFRTRCCCP